MKRYKALLPLVMALLLVSAACAPASTASTVSPAVSSSAAPAAAVTSPAAVSTGTSAQVSAAAGASSGNISELIPYLKAPEKISVYIGPTSWKFFGGNVYAEPTAAQAAQLSALLGSIDSADFKSCGSGLGGAGFKLLIQHGSDSCQLTVFNDNNNSYIVFTTDGGAHLSYFSGAPEAVPFIDLSEACRIVMADTSDPENCGVMLSLDGSNETRTLVKADTAKLVNILDGTAEYYGPYKGAETYSFDGQVTIGKTVYKLDSTSGIFSRTRDGKTEIFKLEDYLVFCTLMMTGKQPG